MGFGVESWDLSRERYAVGYVIGRRRLNLNWWLRSMDKRAPAPPGLFTDRYPARSVGKRTHLAHAPWWPGKGSIAAEPFSQFASRSFGIDVNVMAPGTQFCVRVWQICGQIGWFPAKCDR